MSHVDKSAPEALPADTVSAACAELTVSPATTITNTESELFYRLGERLFGAVAQDMVRLGWSVFPQKRDGQRKPGTVHGGTIRIKTDHDLENRLPAPDALEQWIAHCACDNLAVVFGPASGHTFCLDIDILDAAISAEVAKLADEVLGYTPFRRQGLAPKLALIYRQPAEGSPRVRNRTLTLAETAGDGRGGTTQIESEHEIEVLADGKILTLHGVHHKTGRYFNYLGSGCPLFQGPEAAPEVSAEQLEKFFKALNDRFPIYKTPSAGGGVPTLFGDASGVRVPQMPRGEFKRTKESGRISDGREAYAAKLAFEVARGNGYQIMEAAAQGEHTLDALIGRLSAAAWSEFAANADLSGSRWGGEGAKNEIARRVQACARKLARGEIKPARILASERAQDTPEVQAARRAEVAALPYVPLGADSGVYYFVDRHHQVRSFSAQALEKTATLNELAPPDHWFQNFGTENGGVNGMMAADTLMSQAREAGVYDPEVLMGRGAWWINGRAVFHDGARVFADGIEHGPGHVAGRIFPHARSLGVSAAKPLTAKEASVLFEITARWEWRDQKGMSTLAAASIAQSTICGALPWRTHYMVSAEYGSGKTEYMKFNSRILGTLAIDAMGDSTAKGILQALKFDALPILMDEPESQSENDRRNTQDLVNMFRKASSETGAKTYKGTTDHRGTSFKNSCMGILAAIQSPIVQAADVSRWVPLDMVVRGDEATRKAKWQETQRLLAQVPADFGVRLLARMLHLLPTIRRNIDSFGAAIAKNGGSGRMGMNLGVPLACAWALRSDAEVSEEEATQMLRQTAWISGAVEEARQDPEWKRAFTHLCQQRIEVALSHGPKEFLQIGECVGVLSGVDSTWRNHGLDIKQALGRAGIRVEGRGERATVALANTSASVGDALQGTPWATGWVKVLERAEGATKKMIRFTPTYQSRSTVVPVKAFLDLNSEAVFEGEMPRIEDGNVVEFEVYKAS